MLTSLVLDVLEDDASMRTSVGIMIGDTTPAPKIYQEIDENNIGKDDSGM